MSTPRTQSSFRLILVAALATAAVAGPVAVIAQDAPSRSAAAAAPAFAVKALDAFFGAARASYFGTEGPLRAQVISALAVADSSAGASPRARDIGGGLILRTGCGRLSCEQAGAVVYDTTAQTVVVAGLIHSACNAAGADCSGAPTLTVFTSSRHPVPLPAFVALDGWAEAKVPDIDRDMRTLP